MTRTEPVRSGRIRTLGFGAGLFLLAFCCRLVPTLRGGGLEGYGDYDDSVYFGSALGLVHGRLPYRDFLLLHPPVAVLLLAPSAALAHVTGDRIAFAVGRLSWMALGSATALLVAAVLRRRGRFAAVLGGLSYAVFYPAVYGEHTTLLEAPQNTVLLAGLLVIQRSASVDVRDRRATLLWMTGGSLIGLDPLVKVWGIVPLVAVAVWIGLRAGRWSLGRWALGVAVSVVVVLGPFAAAAPSRLVDYLIRDQWGRLSSGWVLPSRLSGLAGLGPDPSGRVGPLLVVACLGWAVATVVALRHALSRFHAMLHVVVGVFLLAIPTWFGHYATFAAATAALVVGSAGQSAADWLDRRGVRAGRLVRGVIVLAVLGSAVPVLFARFGHPFPHDRLAPSVRSSGCVTSDDVANLIELDLVARNLARGCRLVVDLGGYSYNQAVAGRQVPRVVNPIWQRTAIEYLGSGSRVVLSRFATTGTAGPFDRASKRTIDRWPLLARTRRAVVRAPS